MSIINLIDKIGYHLSQPKLNIFKTIYFNFRVLPFYQAMKLPIFFYGKVSFYWLKGDVKFQNTRIKRGMIKFGRNTEFMTGLKKSAFVLLSPGSLLIFEGPCSFGNDFILRLGDNSALRLGEYTFIGGNVKIICTKRITIGRYSRIAFESQLIDSNFHFIINTKNNTIKSRDKEIIIGAFNWIGNRSSISKGSRTKDNTIVTSGSLLNKDFTNHDEKYLIVGGSPGRVISTGKKRIYSAKLERIIIEYFKTNQTFEMRLKEFDDNYSDLNKCFIKDN